MQQELESISINGVEYVKKSATQQLPEPLLMGDYVIVRTYSAGVFAGYLDRRDGMEVELLKARRIWKWAGAASLSQLAMEGTSKPSECKFPCPVDRVILTQAIEIIPCSGTAANSIQGVSIWKE